MRDIQTESDCRIGVCPTATAKWRVGGVVYWSDEKIDIRMEAGKLGGNAE